MKHLRLPLRTSWFAILVISACSGHAPDTLFYSNGRIVTGRVEEVGLELVRYRTESAGGSVLVVAEKRELARVKLQGGQEFVLNGYSNDVPATEAFLARKRIISMDVLAPALNHFTLAYEHGIGRRMSLCGSVGYIGLWDYSSSGSESLNSKGGLFRLGVKFILPRGRRNAPSAREQHPLAGWYLRPDLMMGVWERRDVYYSPYHYQNSPSKYLYKSGALNLTIGRQLLLGERITFDIHGGFGYGIQWLDGRVTGSDYYASGRQHYSFSHAFLGDVTPLTVSGGVAFGYAF